LPQLAKAGADAASLVRRPDGSVLLVEGDMARPVRAGLLVDALEAALGATRNLEPGDEPAWVEGPPVEVLESRTGAPFVVVGGRKLEVRHLPLTHPVLPALADQLPLGPPIDLRPGKSRLKSRASSGERPSASATALDAARRGARKLRPPGSR
jgi:hypothetical protein